MRLADHRPTTPGPLAPGSPRLSELLARGELGARIAAMARVAAAMHMAASANATPATAATREAHA